MSVTVVSRQLMLNMNTIDPMTIRPFRSRMLTFVEIVADIVFILRYINFRTKHSVEPHNPQLVVTGFRRFGLGQKRQFPGWSRNGTNHGAFVFQFVRLYSSMCRREVPQIMWQSTIKHRYLCYNNANANPQLTQSKADILTTAM
jgi:hypothetical protein